ncbi:osteomodulin [Leptinotarsa decemlineata]|uniref:osteomodulin n=1 Tax=Leptinotarsa decemlineata TaxID=7539 RepID=UPI003D30667C
MLTIQAVILLFLPFCFAAPSEITFRNVTFKGYSVFIEKFKKTIPLSNSLKDFLPEVHYDDIEFKNQNIPILYENSLADLDELDELVIENCAVHEIRPGVLKNVPLLRRLSLKGNRLEKIETGVFNNLPLSTLDLGLNSIRSISANAFNDMPNLLNINLADNKITRWNPNWFQNTPLLTRISLQNNAIETLPSHAFVNLEGEKIYGKLDLRINLIFSHNKIKTIHSEAFAGLKKINNLWLDFNQIEQFEDDLLENVVIDDLRLNNNNISCFEGDFDKLFRADTTHIDSNPMECECLQRIEEWSKKSGKRVEHFYADLECRAQRIKSKMTALEKRLKEVKIQDKETDTNMIY